MENIREILNRRQIDNIPNYPDLAEVDELEELRKSLHISSLDNTFDKFKPVKGTELALRTLQSLIEGNTGWNMVLVYGGVGNGKTHLLEAVAIEVYKQGKFAKVLTMSQVMSYLKRGMDTEYGINLDHRIRILSQMPILLIDDVGMGSSGSAWEWGQLEDIIVNRYRDGLMTVMTTNMDITKLPERIVSRFRDPEKGRVVLNEGADYRVPNKQ